MKRLFFSLILLIIAVWFGVKIAADPGYMLLAYQHWTMEMPLWIAIFLELILIALIYGIVRLLHNTFTLPQRFRLWLKQRRLLRAQRYMHQGFFALTSGQWQRAEKKLIQATPHNTLAWYLYLAAAEAAQQQQEFERRDQYLTQAYQASSATQYVVSIRQSELQIDAAQEEQALAVLQRLHQLDAKQPYVLQLLADVYQRLHDWENLAKLLPALQKTHNANTYAQLEIAAIQGILTQAAAQENIANLHATWQQLSRQHRENLAIIECYAQLLISKQADVEAEALIRKTIAKHWSLLLVNAYGLISHANLSRMLESAEKWLAHHPNDPVLLLTLGRICLHNQLWGKARNYLEASVGIDPQPSTYQELAKLFEQLQENEQAYLCYKQGLLLTLQRDVKNYAL